MGFSGFSNAALDFYDDLELDNTKAFWDANKHIYAVAVREPMIALTEELAEEFGAAKLFRPHRDVRFSKDKSPVKTHQGAYVPVAEGTGWYVALSAAGVFVGGGFYSSAPAQTKLMRAGIDDKKRGPQLERVVARLAAEGYSIGGEQLKTAPRDYSAQHPRIELLRHKSLTAGVEHTHEETAIFTAELVDLVRTEWRQLRPLIDWLAHEFR